jgi:hypothetical protein
VCLHALAFVNKLLLFGFVAFLQKRAEKSNRKKEKCETKIKCEVWLL